MRWRAGDGGVAGRSAAAPAPAPGTACSPPAPAVPARCLLPAAGAAAPAAERLAPPRPRPPRRRRRDFGEPSDAAPLAPAAAALLAPAPGAGSCVRSTGAGRESPIFGRGGAGTCSAGLPAPPSPSAAGEVVAVPGGVGWPGTAWPVVGSDIECVPSRARVGSTRAGRRAEGRRGAACPAACAGGTARRLCTVARHQRRGGRRRLRGDGSGPAPHRGAGGAPGDGGEAAVVGASLEAHFPTRPDRHHPGRQSIRALLAAAKRCGHMTGPRPPARERPHLGCPATATATGPPGSRPGLSASRSRRSGSDGRPPPGRPRGRPSAARRPRGRRAGRLRR